MEQHAALVKELPGMAVSHSGVTLGPLWRRVVAAELLDGALDSRLAPDRPARFL
jgi:hypothetical protein